MSNIYENMGFWTNPFAHTNADEEDYLKDYFIEPPYFDSVIGDYKSPSSCVVLAPRGGGKSAQRKMIEIWSQDHPVLAITYDRFEFGPRQKIEDISLSYHLRNIITLILLNIIIRASEKPEILSSLPKNEKRQLNILCHNYLGDFTGRDVKEVLSKLKTVPEKIKTFIENNIGFLEPLVNYVLKTYDLEEIDIPELEQEKKKLDKSYKFQLELLYEIAKKLGFESIYILIDKVDETELTGNNTEDTFKLIRPLIRDLDTLSTKGYAFKFFLWDKVRPYYIKEARPDRIQEFRLEWKRGQLETLLEKRVKAFSNNNIKNMRQIFNQETDIDPDKVITVLAWLSPRNIIRLSDEILSQQSLIDRNANKIDLKALDKASQIFSERVVQEMYEEDMVRDFKKVDRELFTINYLSSNIFKISHTNTSRNKVTKWENAGAIKFIGTGKIEGAKRSVQFYYFTDPKIIRMISSKIPIGKFFEEKLSRCPNCDSDILISKNLVPSKAELCCWNCESPIFKN